MPYWRLFYHVVWATKKREPLIGAHHHDTIQRAIRAMGQAHRALVHAVGIMPDHVHVVMSIPPSIAISTLIDYANNQPARHASQNLWPALGETGQPIQPLSGGFVS